MNPSRRRLLAALQAIAALPALTLAAAPRAEPARGVQTMPPIRFLGQAESARALTEGRERDYYARLQLAEMRAKTGLALEGMSLEAARELARASYASSTQDFSAQEQAALERTVRAALEAVGAQAPVYARTPWSFIKVEARIEGGLPHTRGGSIVLSDVFLADAASRFGADWAAAPAGLRSLLIHEQTHVLQRRLPQRFERLYVDAFGFRKSDAVPPRWLMERNVTNPDGPDLSWIFPTTGSGAAQRWVLPDVVLNRLDHPRMPDDFALVAIDIREGPGGSWVFPDSPAALHELSGVSEYQRAFPDHSEDFHPNEISASMLSSLLLGLALRNPDHALWDKTRAWIARALR